MTPSKRVGKPFFLCQGRGALQCDASLRAAQSLKCATPKKCRWRRRSSWPKKKVLHVVPLLEERAIAAEELGVRAQRVGEAVKSADDAALLLQTLVDIAAERMCLVVRSAKPVGDCLVVTRPEATLVQP